MRFLKILQIAILLNTLLIHLPAFSEVVVHPIFSDHMVIQRDAKVKIWGTAEPSDSIQVNFAAQEVETTADSKGHWAAILQPMPINTVGQNLIIKGRDSEIELSDILVGDVWLCGGQSNMEFSLERIYQGDIEIASARHPQIRLMTIPNKASPDRLPHFQPLNEFNAWTNEHELKGSWQVCSPESVNRFAAIGYIFARRLYLATGVPIGIIDNSVGGTTVEGWTSRDSLARIPEATGLLDDWDARIESWDAEKDLAEQRSRWEKDTERRKANGQNPRPKPDRLKPGPSVDRNNPGASYNAMLASFAGFRLTGIIFHQGYNNALGDSRPQLYAKTFQSMITDWRTAFDDPNLPFGIIELCAGAEPQTLDDFELRMVDAGPYIRESQFKAYEELENIGWACAYDQQVNWYHPQMKVQLAERIARWALATRYGMQHIGHEPARLISHNIVGDKITLSFDRELTVRDGRPIAGMAIANGDNIFFPATAKFVVRRKDERGRDVFDYRKIEVSSPLCNAPVAVRYAWARCPLGNLTNRAHMERTLPVPSFRTDDWDWPEAPFGKDQRANRRKINELRTSAKANTANRKRQAASLE